MPAVNGVTLLTGCDGSKLKSGKLSAQYQMTSASELLPAPMSPHRKTLV